MMLQPIPITVVSGVRRTGWRSVLREGDATAWRCSCFLPHSTPERALACGTEALSRRASHFYPGGYDMNDWLPVPQTDAERQALIEQIQSLPTKSSDDAIDQLVMQRALIMNVAEGYEQVRMYQAAASGIKEMWRANRDVRNQFDYTFLAGEQRIGQMLLLEKKAPGGQPYQEQNATRFSGERVGTIAEKVGNRTYGWRMETIAPLSPEALASFIQEYHQKDKEASLTGVVKIIRAGESEMRRMDSMTAPEQSSLDLRIGDCRAVWPDIQPGSIPLILTDPPYEDGAEPLWRWLAKWSFGVLADGGSLICYFGGANVNKLYRIFDDAGLTHWWPCVMMHDQAQRLAGKFVIASTKPVLWYVKGYRRNRHLVPDLVYAEKRRKAKHAWGQGDGGITQWIHQLTEPGETIIDPFCGTGEWGLITCREGRKWKGSDIAAGGTTTVMADDLEEND